MSNSKAKRRWLIPLIIVVALIVAAVVGLIALNHQHQAKTAQEDQAAEEAELPRYSKLSDIKFDDDKVNMYLFWGNGCIHCTKLYEFLEEIQPEYGQYYRLYSFEIWDNEDNDKIMDWFMAKLGRETGSRSTPTFIIGDKLFEGFSEGTKDEIKQTIRDMYDHRDQITDFSDVKNLKLD